MHVFPYYMLRFLSDIILDLIFAICLYKIVVFNCVKLWKYTFEQIFTFVKICLVALCTHEQTNKHTNPLTQNQSATFMLFYIYVPRI